MEKQATWKKILYSLSPVFVFVLLFVLMELAIDVYEVPSWLLAKPTEIGAALITNIGEIWANLKVTLIEILLGYLIGVSFGILLALIFTSNQFLDRAISPYVIFLIVTPQIILVPLLMLELGFGVEVKIVAVALSSFPINMMSTMTGLRSVSADRYELMKSLRATNLQTVIKVLVPSALPNVFTGMRLATIFATTSAVGAELLCGNTGVGPRISYYTEYMSVDISFAYVLVMVLVGVVFYTVVGAMENYVTKRNR